jgi:hypothetical protein
LPIFHFHIVDEESLTPDEEGMFLTDLEAASQEALESARELLIQDIRASRPLGDRRIEVTDEAGSVVYIIKLRSLIV